MRLKLLLVALFCAASATFCTTDPVTGRLIVHDIKGPLSSVTALALREDAANLDVAGAFDVSICPP